MRIVRPASADEMVATFLKAEIASSRISSYLEGILAAKGVDRRIIEEPDLGSSVENWVRGEVLAEYRGYGRDQWIFEKFPSDILWMRAEVGTEDLARLRYVDHGYWNRLSGGTRRVLDGARNVRGGVAPYGVSNEPFFAVASRVAAGERLPEPILVAEDEGSDLVILEGHLRMTSYLLNERLPDRLEALIGLSPGVRGWIGTESPYIPPEDRALSASFAY